MRSLFRHYGQFVSENQAEPKHFEKTQFTQQEHSQNQPTTVENIVSAVGGLLDIQPIGMDYDPDEAEFQRLHKPKKKKEAKKGVRM